MESKTLGRAALQGFTKEVDERLGRSLRDGLVGLGLAFFVNSIAVWAMPTESLAPIASALGLDLLEHEATLRRVALGTLLEGAGSLASLIAGLSFCARTTWSMGRAAWTASKEGQTHA